MAKQVQLRRGTDAQNSTFTGAAGELIALVDTQTIALHDGTTVGGHKLASESFVETSINGLISNPVGTNEYTKPEVDSMLSVKADTVSLANVATSGSYVDLTNKPTLFSGEYSALVGAPILANVATSGSYTDLINAPTLFSGSFSDLTNKPILANVATSGSYTDLINTPTLFSGEYAALSGLPSLSTVATTGSYTDLINKPATTAGANGKSAYELAVEGGFTGSESEWLSSLRGERGPIGMSGSDGFPGKSAYLIAVEAGLVTYGETEVEWLASLKGEPGPQGIQGPAGADGLDAYEEAVQRFGFTGTFVEWIASFKGAKGDTGDKGDQGTVGPQGPQGVQGEPGAIGPQGIQGIQGPSGATLLAVPTSPIGIDGDTKGMLSADATYFYYCIADFDGTTLIWKRIANDTTWTA